MSEIKAVTYVRCGKRRFSSRKYAKQFLKKVNTFKNFDLTKPVGKYLNNMLIERYPSVSEAGRKNGVTGQTITQTINSGSKLQGLSWKFVQ